MGVQGESDAASLQQVREYASMLAKVFSSFRQAPARTLPDVNHLGSVLVIAIDVKPEIACAAIAFTCLDLERHLSSYRSTNEHNR